MTADTLKTTRVLELYQDFLSGKLINKQQAAEQYHVNARSIQRDIDSIRDFLSEQCAKEGIVRKIEYDKKENGYSLVTQEIEQLSRGEVLALCKILLESRAFTKEQVEKQLQIILNLCVSQKEKSDIEWFISNELFNYHDPAHAAIDPDNLWMVAQAIRNQSVLEIEYHMLTALRNNKSLTFYQTTEFRPKFSVDSSYTGGITATAISSTAYTTATVTTQFNNQLNAFLDAFHAERERIANKVAEGLAKDSEYTGARNDAVKLAWDYEKADVEMGGRGSSDWDDAQCQEIKETGKVRGAEGHHQKNVADHPEDQGDPDNIKFYKSRKEHLEKGHNGDFHNSSDAPKIDKDKMLKKTNSKRVFRNEIKGIGIAAAIGIGVGFTIGFAVSLAQTGVTPDSIKYALVNGGKSGLSSGIQSTIGYGIGRTVGQLASQALTGVFSNVGLEITENIAKMCNMGAVGAITIGVFSTVQFVKLVCKGESLKTAAIQVGKQALFSLSLLVVSITAQGIFGGPSGIIVSVGVGVIFVTYTIADTVHQRNYSEKLRVYMIEKCKPIFA